MASMCYRRGSMPIEPSIPCAVSTCLEGPWSVPRPYIRFVNDFALFTPTFSCSDCKPWAQLIFLKKRKKSWSAPPTFYSNELLLGILFQKIYMSFLVHILLKLIKSIHGDLLSGSCSKIWCTSTNASARHAVKGEQPKSTHAARLHLYFFNTFQYCKLKLHIERVRF